VASEGLTGKVDQHFTGRPLARACLKRGIGLVKPPRRADQSHLEEKD
jgi:hypothetical protein